MARPPPPVNWQSTSSPYTWGGAYASFEEDLKGTLREGMLADLAVLDTDLFETEPADWLEARVDYTIVGGRVVYDRARDERNYE